ncbi:hypothetical protein L1987_60562 [Smallanthus sonchifolius]|uniref:Uncharacterized protein n=1 Tax=Smallanthus sonchifolius TaxID=185202 RepID=A0ACB9D8D1_9ASTR|nr:hypothetical protein L1987_60562 [Smallanthus sonchifolius]
MAMSISMLLHQHPEDAHKNDVEKLRRDYNLVVERTADLGALATDAYGVRELKNAGLNQLASRVLGREIEKPMSVTMSRWDDECLSPAQMHSIDPTFNPVET